MVSFFHFTTTPNHVSCYYKRAAIATITAAKQTRLDVVVTLLLILEEPGEGDPPVIFDSAMDAANAFFPAASSSAGVASGLDFFKSAMALSLASVAFLVSAILFALDAAASAADGAAPA